MDFKAKIKNVLNIDRFDSVILFNCWGTTAYVLGDEKDLKWMGQTQMEKWLDTNSLTLSLGTDEVRAEDILVLESDTGLVHTAIYVGESEWFHKKGQNFPEVTNSMSGMIKVYEEAIQAEIKTSFRRPLKSPYIAKIA